MTARPVPQRYWRRYSLTAIRINAVLLVLAITGCTDLHTDLQDEHGRWVESCRGTGFGLVTGLIAHSVYNDCMDRARAAGLKPIN
jgi:homoserine acetyltransferase